VLGIDIEALGAAVARHWGLGEEMLHMIRCLPKDRPVRAAESDSDTLRITASAANEAVDALLASMAEGAEGGPVVAGSSKTLSKAAAAKAAAVRNVPAQRYAKSLGLTPRGVQEALATAREALRTGAPVDPSESSGRAEAVWAVRPATAPS
jgi:non-specific serine/threonine protein kinase